jgi:hypothetical protein
VELPSTITLPTGFSGFSPGRNGKAPGEPVTITSPGCSVYPSDKYSMMRGTSNSIPR